MLSSPCADPGGGLFGTRGRSSTRPSARGARRSSEPRQDSSAVGLPARGPQRRGREALGHLPDSGRCRVEGLLESTLEALRQKAKDKSSASELAAIFASATADPQDSPEEFDEHGTAFRDLRVGELRTALENYIFTDASGRQGDMAMVHDWKSLGFVRDKTVRLSPDVQVQVKAETERDVFSAASFREHFYKLLNVNSIPGIL